VPVDQSADKAEFGNGALQFGGRGVWVLVRQCRETAEAVGISARGLGQVIVGPVGQVEALLGPLYFRLLVTGEPLDDEFIEGVVDLVYTACTLN
jgi:hypothetical protein